HFSCLFHFPFPSPFLHLLQPKEDPASKLLLAIEHPFAGRRVSQLRSITASTLHLSRASSIVMLSTYIAYLVFQLWTHRQLFEAKEGEDDDVPGEEAVIGFCVVLEKNVPYVFPKVLCSM
uniref:Uncharacterized protein n=1 Tax=Cucumis melo TaxID=3656 RepID=A0A9I9EKM3_CUCME